MKNNLIKATVNFLNEQKVHNHELKVENEEILVKKVTDEEWVSLGQVNTIEYITINADMWIEFHYHEVEGEIDALYLNQYGIEV